MTDARTAPYGTTAPAYTTDPALTTTAPVHGATAVRTEPVVYPAPILVRPRSYKRGFIVSTLTSIALIFWLIAMTTPIGMVNGDEPVNNATAENADGTGKLTVDPWHACTRRNADSVSFCRPMGHPDEDCTETRDMFRVEQAFLLLTGIMLIPLLVCAALDFSHKLDVNTPDLPFGLHTHGWMIFFAFITALVSCVAFAVGFAIPRSRPCNNGALYEQNDFEWGPSPIFSLLVFIVSLIIIVVALLLRRDASVKTKEEIMHPHQHANHPMTVRPTEPVAP